MENKRNKKKGFTLIEMVVVLAIIGILAAIAIPQALSSINSAKKTADIANAKAIAGAITQVIANNQTNNLTQNQWTKVDTSITNIDDFINSIPKPKKVSGDFYYFYDGNQLKIGVPGATSGQYIELYPNPDSNY